jgi:hypothetical protein
MPLPFQLTESQLERIKPCFPLSHGVARIDDLRVISGIVLAHPQRAALEGRPARIRAT